MYETQAEIDQFFKCLFQFRPLKKLGEGAFGIAILVLDEVEQVRKVFKLPKDKRTTDALCKEGANLVKLSELLHPNIIRLHQFGKVRMEWNGVEEDRYYLNMAFGGSSLRSKLGPLRTELDENGNVKWSGSGSRLPLEEAVRIAVDVCKGLEAAHGFRDASIRMLHRDIKPDNILIDHETGIARLSDFGISRVIDRSSAQVSGAGSYPYMDPECFHSRATVQSDFYSLGVVIYEMVTGELPFSDFKQRLEGPPQPPTEIVPDLDADLEAVVLRTLETELSARYPAAGDLLSDLRKLQAKLNPLPSRYTRISRLDDGRCLSTDEETSQRVAIRLVRTAAPLSEFAHQCNLLESLNLSAVEIPLRQFSNEQFVGIVSREPRGSDLLERYGGKSLESLEKLHELCNTVARVCDLLASLHRAGLCHGFLSPSAIGIEAGEIWLRDSGNGPVLRARRVAGSADESIHDLGPLLPFMSPQMLAASHDPGPADDIYTLGAVLFTLLVGRPPLEQEDRHRLMLGGAVAEPSYNPRNGNPLVPPQVAGLVTKALRFNPHDRPRDMAEMAATFRACRWPQDTVGALIADALQAYPTGCSPAELLKACDRIDLALRIDPGNAEAHFARGVIYFRDGSYRYAVEEFDKVVRIAPSQEALDLLGQSYEAWNRQYERAIEAYGRALAFAECPSILHRLARLLNTTGRQQEAIRTMQRAVECETDESLRQRRLLILKQWTGGQAAAVASTELFERDDAEPQKMESDDDKQPGAADDQATRTTELVDDETKDPS